MAFEIELQRPITKSETGVQDPQYATDVGGAEKIVVRLRVYDITGTLSTDLDFVLQTAMVNEEDEYTDLITFTSITSGTEAVEISASADHARYIRWALKDLGGATEVKFGFQVLTR